MKMVYTFLTRKASNISWTYLWNIWNQNYFIPIERNRNPFFKNKLGWYWKKYPGKPFVPAVFIVKDSKYWIQFLNKYWSNHFYLFFSQPCIIQWIFLLYKLYNYYHTVLYAIISFDIGFICLFYMPSIAYLHNFLKIFFIVVYQFYTYQRTNFLFCLYSLLHIYIPLLSVLNFRYLLSYTIF